jgi:hypothetical protein
LLTLPRGKRPSPPETFHFILLCEPHRRREKTDRPITMMPHTAPTERPIRSAKGTKPTPRSTRPIRAISRIGDHVHIEETPEHNQAGRARCIARERQEAASGQQGLRRMKTVDLKAEFQEVAAKRTVTIRTTQPGRAVTLEPAARDDQGARKSSCGKVAKATIARMLEDEPSRQILGRRQEAAQYQPGSPAIATPCSKVSPAQ